MADFAKMKKKSLNSKDSLQKSSRVAGRDQEIGNDFCLQPATFVNPG